MIVDPNRKPNPGNLILAKIDNFDKVIVRYYKQLSLLNTDHNYELFPANTHQIRRTAWVHTIKRAGIRYRNPYQTRHTYVSMMLSGGENIMWVASQMGHVDTEMVMKTYDKWIPNKSSKKGYQTVNNWACYID